MEGYERIFCKWRSICSSPAGVTKNESKERKVVFMFESLFFHIFTPNVSYFTDLKEILLSRPTKESGIH